MARVKVVRLEQFRKVVGALEQAVGTIRTLGRAAQARTVERTARSAPSRTRDEFDRRLGRGRDERARRLRQLGELADRHDSEMGALIDRQADERREAFEDWMETGDTAAFRARRAGLLGTHRTEREAMKARHLRDRKGV